MTEDYPVPPPELVEQWRAAPEYTNCREKLTMVSMTTRRLQEIATQAARWGYRAKMEADRRWFCDNPFEDMTNSMLQNCRIVLAELQGARDLAIQTGHDPSEVSGHYLEMLLKICRDHVALEQIRKDSAN